MRAYLEALLDLLEGGVGRLQRLEHARRRRRLESVRPILRATHDVFPRLVDDGEQLRLGRQLSGYICHDVNMPNELTDLCLINHFRQLNINV